MIDDQKNTVIFDEVECPPQERNWLARTFGKLEKDSLRSTIFLMMAGTLGAGVYALHKTFDEAGIFWAIVLLIIGCVSSLLALDMYIHASRSTSDPESVSEINQLIVGKKFDITATAVCAIFLYLIMISFTVCISKVMFNLLSGPISDYFNLGIAPIVNDENLGDFMYYHKFFSVAIGLLAVGFIIPRSADLISTLSIPCFLIHLYIITVIICQTYSSYQTVKLKGWDNLNYFKGSWRTFFGNFGLAICTFNNVPNFMMVRTLVKSPSTARLRKIFNRSNWIIMGIYTITALCGYLTVGHQKDIPDMIIFRKSYHKTDYLMNIGTFLLALSLIVSYALLGFALKMMLLPFIPGNDNFKHIGFSFALVLTVAGIALNLHSVGAYINLAGSFGGTFIVIIFPAILALKSGYSKNNTINIGIKMWLLLGSISGALSTYLAIMKIMEKFKKQ